MERRGGGTMAKSVEQGGNFETPVTKFRAVRSVAKFIHRKLIYSGFI